MEAIAILDAVVLGLEIARSITAFITELKHTELILGTIHDQVNHIALQLNHLQSESRVRFLSADLMKAWLGYQNRCNGTLRDIQDILKKHSKLCESSAVVADFKFKYLEGEDKLRVQLESIQRCNDYFGFLKR